MNLKDIKDVCIKNNVKVDGDYITFDASTKDFQLTKNFRLKEFLTKNKKDTTTKINLKIVLELQAIRDAFGSGIGISSSYRSVSYNRSINGATSSQHIYGNALDIFPINKDVKGLLNTVLKFKTEGGIGEYSSFVHIDCRSGKAFWKGK